MTALIDEAPADVGAAAADAAAALSQVPAPASSAPGGEAESKTAPAGKPRRARSVRTPRKRATGDKAPSRPRPGTPALKTRVARAVGELAGMLELASPPQAAVLKHNAERWGLIADAAATRSPAARRLIEGALELGNDTGTVMLLVLCVSPHLALAGVLPGKAGQLVPMVATMAGTMPAELPDDSSPLAGLAGMFSGATGAELGDEGLTVNLNGSGAAAQ